MKKKSLFIFIGGYYPTLRTEEIFNIIPEINCAVIGEGENVCVELAEALKTDNSWKNIKGIAYIDNKNLKINEHSEPIINLDHLPFPTRILNEYSKIFSIVSSRGCYNSCSFCGIRKFLSNSSLPKVRYRSVKNVITEMEFIVKEYNPNLIKFTDETFLISNKNRLLWIDEFITDCKSRNININMCIQAKANDIIFFKGKLGELKEIGLQFIFIGIESFSQRQLDYFKKTTSVSCNKESLLILKEKKIKFQMGFILLDPYSTISEIIDNL